MQGASSAAPAPVRPGPVTPEAGNRIRYGTPLHDEVMDFLIEEAWSLDEDRFDLWLGMLVPEILYVVPIRQSKNRAGGRGYQTGAYWIYDDLPALTFKVNRMLVGDSGWAEDPPSRVRRSITNVRLFETSVPGEYLAQSHVLVRRNRNDAHLSDTLSGRRDDILRRVDGTFKLVQRTVLIDQAVLGMPNFAIFI